MTRRFLSVVTLPLLLAACTGAETAGPVGTTTTIAVAVTTTTVAPVPTITITNKTVSPAPSRLSVAKGATFTARITADVNDEIHVHGYDKSFPAVAGSPSVISFVADTPGVFEVELEKAGILLFNVEVK